MLVVEVKHILRTGLWVQPISVTNGLPRACASQEATRNDHKAIMEEANKCGRLEYEDKDKDKGEGEGEDEDGSEE